MALGNWNWGGAAAPRPAHPSPGGGNQGGMMGLPGMMPYKPNPVAEGAQSLATILGGISSFQQSQKDAAGKRLEKVMNDLQLGLVSPQQLNMKKIASDVKKSGRFDYLDFDSPTVAGATQITRPQGPPQQPPQQGPEMSLAMPGQQPNVPGMMGMVQQPPPPPQMPMQQRPMIAPGMIQNSPQGALGKIGGALGNMMGTRGANPQSAGAMATTELAQKVYGMGQKQRSVESEKQKIALQETQYKSKVMELMIAATTMEGPDRDKARTILVSTGVIPKMEADDLTMWSRLAENKGASPEQVADMTQMFIREKLGVTKFIESTDRIAQNLVKDGYTTGEAYQTAYSMLQGNGLPGTPKIKQQTIKDFLGDMKNLTEMYPRLPPSVLKAVAPHVLAGNAEAVKNIMGQSDTAAYLKERREDSQLSVSQRNAATSERNATTSSRAQQFSEQQAQFNNQVRTMGMLINVAETKGLEGEERWQAYTIVQNMMPGMFRLKQPVVNTMWPDEKGQIMAPPKMNPEQEPTNGPDDGWMKWFKTEFVPAFKSSAWAEQNYDRLISQGK